MCVKNGMTREVKILWHSE
uniref:Uncharacterized protein n=1 Tax=Anguilla anguilla TaxID=7936 RepID=A0A0E9PRW2_ANGAN